ncbi:MAG: hypothetical protein M1835_002012 [Candelina submexicana]|nr:MAG: hypothetical protein M1835_002012 [Candelina submexicana]
MQSSFLLLLASLLVFVHAQTKLYVGNLSWSTTEDTLRNVFQDYGQVLDAIVMRDRDTGLSRGFGFVTMSSQGEAEAAIDGLNEQELDGRRIKVNLVNAKPSNVDLNNQEVMVGKGRLDYNCNDDSKRPEVVVEVLRSRNGGSVLVFL